MLQLIRGFEILWGVFGLAEPPVLWSTYGLTRCRLDRVGREPDADLLEDH
jgi:hypothetical protein